MKETNHSMMHTHTRMCFCLPKLSVRDNDQFDREKKLEIFVYEEPNKVFLFTFFYVCSNQKIFFLLPPLCSRYFFPNINCERKLHVIDIDLFRVVCLNQHVGIFRFDQLKSIFLIIKKIFFWFLSRTINKGILSQAQFVR